MEVTGGTGGVDWRVTANGVDSAVRDGNDPHWGRDESLAAHRRVERTAAGSGLSVRRSGHDGAGDDVEAAVTVRTDDADAAREAAATLLGRALPSVTWERFDVEPLAAHDGAGHRATPAPGLDE